MIVVKDKTKCCGCTACENICPLNCITMEADSEGFLYPLVDKKRCIECGACEKICPILNELPKLEYERQAFVIRAKDKNTVKQSTSGGFITPLFQWVIKNAGVVCSATYDDTFNIVHRVYTEITEDEYKKIRGSKYVQSDLNGCFVEIKKYLKEERLVCFVGTTCQIYGLRCFLKRDYNNLILVDLVCHGVTSPKLWNKYVDYQKKKYKSEINNISFRKKTYGYHSSTMQIEFSNNKIYSGSARIDIMLKSFFEEIASRPACYECKFKKVKRISDFTLYDCWHASDLVEDLIDDDKGYTNIIVQSEKGSKILEEIKEFYELYPTDIECAIDKDGKMVCNKAIAHPKRKEFYVNLDSVDIKKHVNKYIPISIWDHIVERSKKFVYATGLYNTIKKLKS